MVILQSHLKSLVQDLLEYGKLTSLGTSNLFKQEVYTVELSRSLNPESTVGRKHYQQSQLLFA